MSRAILIPADADLPITEVDVDLTDFRSMANAIGSQWIEYVRISDPTHTVVVDEEGLLNRKPLNQRATMLYPGHLAGDALIVGEDGSEDTAPATVSLEQVGVWLVENAR